MSPEEIIELLLDSGETPDSVHNRNLSEYQMLIEQGLGASPEALALKEVCIKFWGIHSQEICDTETMLRFQSYKRRKPEPEGK